ncbi:MAG: family 10 glycosylhydrolase [Armatimonadota bacterium]
MRAFWFAAAAALLTCPALAQEREYRAFWAEGFNAGIHSREQIDRMIQRLTEAHCNGLWQQVRKRGDAHYRSTYEIWARENPQHFDALAYLLEKAHAASPKIHVHAWINTCAVGGDMRPGHILVEHPEYTSISDEGVAFDNEAMKIDPAHPGANDWTFRVYLDVARHYPVDGIHFDFVRYGHPRWGFNPVSVALFNQATGRTGKPAWDDPEFQQWRRDAVTALVRKVYAHTKAIAPEIAVSAATIAWGNGPRNYDEYLTSPPYSRVYQDWAGWMREGILDINCPMLYFSNTRYREFWLNWNEFAKDHKYDRQLVIGQGIWLNSIPDTLQQIQDSRAPSAKGNRADGILLYSYAGTNRAEDGSEQQYNPELYRALSQPGPYGDPPFAIPVDAPPLKPPSGGIVKGFVLTDPWLAPVVRAEVCLWDGRERRQTVTDVTGFYAFIDVPPGRYTVTITPRPFRAQTSQVVIARDGDVVTHHAFPGTASNRISYPWMVVAGNDRCDGVVYLWDAKTGRGRRVLVRPDTPLPFQPGDVVAVSYPGGGLPPVIRLIDISAQWGRRLPRPELQVTPSAKLHGPDWSTGRPVCVEGRVERLTPEGFVLRDGSGTVEVSGRYLKRDFRFSATPGERVRVRGVVDKESGLIVTPFDHRAVEELPDRG